MNHLAFWTESTDSLRRFYLKEWFHKLDCDGWLWCSAVLVHCSFLLLVFKGCCATVSVIFREGCIFNLWDCLCNVTDLLGFESSMLVSTDENLVCFNSLRVECEGTSCECEVHDVQLNK